MLVKAPIPICSPHIYLPPCRSATPGRFAWNASFPFNHSFSLGLVRVCIIAVLVLFPIESKSSHFSPHSVRCLCCLCSLDLSDDPSDSSGFQQGRSGGADDRPPGSGRRVRLRPLQDLHREPENGSKTRCYTQLKLPPVPPLTSAVYSRSRIFPCLMVASTVLSGPAFLTVRFLRSRVGCTA